jgi:predicted dehydrogenase
MGISIGLVGLGAFGSGFADLFMRHPLTDRVGLCDREPERMEAFAGKESWQKSGKFDQKDMYPDLDAICRADFDALVIITQPWLHAPQALQALEAGKHVYSAVPIISIPDAQEVLDWIDKLVNAVKRTGLHYMLGETSYYRPNAMYCRRRAAEGAFGDFVYAEGEYFHDVDSRCSLRNVRANRTASASGQEWLAIEKEYVARGKRNGPMMYPTHSTCGPVFVMRAHAVKVSCYGYRNRLEDPFFAPSEFSNQVAFYTMSNGATVRSGEFREIAGSIAGDETFRIFGTRGSFAEDRWMENGRTDPGNGHPVETTRLETEEMRDPLPAEVAEAWKDESTDTVDYGGHGGSHAYLVHEFISAVAADRVPAVNIWEAARYMAMGAMAHASALRDGERLDVPDWGDAPAD